MDKWGKGKFARKERGWGPAILFKRDKPGFLFPKEWAHVWIGYFMMLLFTTCVSLDVTGLDLAWIGGFLVLVWN